MKKLFFPLIGTVIVIAFSIAYSGCKKDKQDKDTKAAENNAYAENVFADIFKQIKEQASTDTNVARYAQKSDKTGCATLTVSPIGYGIWPKTLTIDFGTTNCQGTDSNWRRGKIICVFSHYYQDSLTTINVSLDNYYFNDNHVTGTKTITNLGHIGHTNGTNNLKFSVVVSNATITKPEGTISWNSTRTNEWIVGEGTPYILDDVYMITGAANGTDVNGNTFTVNITTALKVAVSCRWIESGILEITPQGLPTRTVDYGSGDCDNQATVTINGYTFNIVLG
jgi:hypothetical protein